MKNLITILILLMVCNINAQESFMDSLIASNLEFSADISFKVSADGESQTLSGNMVSSKDLQYTKLSTAEFYSFNNWSVKVSNEERKLEYKKQNSTPDVSSFNPNLKSLKSFYFEPKIQSCDNGFNVLLTPIDAFSGTLGKVELELDKQKKIKVMKIVLPDFNLYGIDTIQINYYNRKDNNVMQINYQSLFLVDDVKGLLIPLNKYKTYSIVNQTNEK